MPLICTHCGRKLPRDDARFCSNCGARVVSSSPTAESQSMQEDSSPISQQSVSSVPIAPPISSVSPVSQQGRKHVLREQIAHQPRPARLTRHIEEEQTRLAPVSQSLEAERHELRVRVWNQPDVPTQSEMSIDDLPTQETPISSTIDPSKQPTSSKASPVWSPPAVSPPTSQVMPFVMDVAAQEQERRRAEIEQQSTIAMAPMTTVPSGQSEPHPTPFFGIQGVQSIQTQPNTSPPASLVPPTPVIHDTASPRPEQESISVKPDRFDPVSVSAAPQLLQKRARRSPLPLVLLGGIMFAVIIAGIAWMTIAQPFNVPSVTQPLQAYRDTHLGFALSYPSDWTITHQSSSDLFSDSSQTAQVMVTVLPASNAPGGSASAYLQKQAAQIGMTGAKTGTAISFAGTTWQQIQGGVQKNGVNDTEALFATLHNNQLFVLTQTAPQSVYADEESVIFSKMRTSLQLL